MFPSVKFAIEFPISLYHPLVVAPCAIHGGVSADYRKSFLKNGEHYHNKSVIAYILTDCREIYCDAFEHLKLEVRCLHVINPVVHNRELK